MLRSKILHSALALTVTAAMLPGSPAQAAKDKPVCYKIGYTNNRIVLDVKKHSDLTTFGLKQTVYDALGKHTFNNGPTQSDNYMAVAHGAVVVASRNYRYPYLRYGAHMGLVSEWVRDYSAPALIRSPIDWDCSSAVESATPDTWTCKSVRGGDAPIAIDLYRASAWDAYCGIFQDGDGYTPPKY